MLTTTCGKWASAISPCRAGCAEFGEAFYGRQAAYAKALGAADPQELEKALARNIFGETAGGETAVALARYVHAATAQLATQPEGALMAGRVDFPNPETFAHA